ncbi:MAG: type IV pilus modification PilV family protein [Planctomycetota bacterium]|jgi:hypothetical protein
MRFANRNKILAGFSLAEAMLATVILSIAAAGVLLPFTGGARIRAEGVHRTLAAELSADLMEQIVNTPFTQIVASYDGYVEPQGQVKDAEGTVFVDTRYANFSREASCEYVYMPQENGTTDPRFVRATIRVYYNGTQIAIIRRLIAG